MHTENVKVNNETGLHARPASLFVKKANEYSSTITILLEDKKANGKSIIDVLLLEVHKGSEIQIQAVGSDEKEAVEDLVSLVNSFE